MSSSNPAGFRDIFQGLVGNPCFESRAVRFLEKQCRDERDEIGVAAALAQAVERALHLARAGVDGGEGIGHRVAGVVVGMDAT